MIDEILDRLDKVKSAGKYKWTACCPVHGDRSPSMSIKEADDGTVLIHCHACGANGIQVVESLGLKAGVLFPPDPDWKPQGLSNRQREKLESEKIEDSMFIILYEQAKKRGDKLTLDDHRRYKLAKSRLHGIKEKLSKSVANDF